MVAPWLSELQCRNGLFSGVCAIAVDRWVGCFPHAPTHVQAEQSIPVTLATMSNEGGHKYNTKGEHHVPSVDSSDQVERIQARRNRIAARAMAESGAAEAIASKGAPSVLDREAHKSMGHVVSSRTVCVCCVACARGWVVCSMHGMRVLGCLHQRGVWCVVCSGCVCWVACTRGCVVCVVHGMCVLCCLHQRVGGGWCARHVCAALPVLEGAWCVLYTVPFFCCRGPVVTRQQV